MSYFIVLHLSYFAHVFKPCARSVSVSELRNGCTPGAVLAYILKAVAFAGLVVQHLVYCYRGGVLGSRYSPSACAGVEGVGVWVCVGPRRFPALGGALHVCVCGVRGGCAGHRARVAHPCLWHP